MERVMGIEPTLPAWKAGVLPLNYTRTSPNAPVSYKAFYILSNFSSLVKRLRANHAGIVTGAKDAQHIKPGNSSDLYGENER